MERSKILVWISVLLIWIPTWAAFGQTRYEGWVHDLETGEGINDVSIQIADSDHWMSTDSTGWFSFISEDTELTLLFSRLGYESQAQNVRSSNVSIKVYLKRNTLDIEEVRINTGYQWIPKERATGSFVHLGETELSRIPGRSVLDKLDGIMPGLQFDKRGVDYKNDISPVITVRGMNTFSIHTTHPLIIVDDFPYEGDLNDINPNDVESVTLLRDAAATSIWGARAGNGVIVINLKKPGNTGRTSINWSSDISIIEKPDLYHQPIMTSSDFVDVELFLYDNGHYQSALTGSNAYRTVFSPVVQGMFDVEQGRISQIELEHIINSARNHDYRDEMLTNFYRNKISQRHHISVSKQVNNYVMRVSAGMDRQDGTENLKGERSNNRYSFSMNNTYQFAKNIDAELNVNYFLSNNQTNGSVHYPLNPSGGKSSLYPYARLFDEGGRAMAIPQGGLNLNFVDTAGVGTLLDWKYYPYEEMSYIQNTSHKSRLNPTLSLRYSPMQRLTLEAIYSANLENSSTERSYSEESYYVRELVNRYTSVSGDQVQRSLPFGDILAYGNSIMNAHKLRVHAKMDGQIFGGDHLSWIIGGETSDIETVTRAQMAYGYNPFLMLSVPVDYVSRHPLYLGGTSTIPDGQYYTRGVQRLVSFYANASYVVYDKYVISGSARRDASNVFGSKSNERWNPLWSMGFSWNIAKEDFMEDLDWISQMRFRFTHGYSGNLGGGTTSDRTVITSVGTAQLTGLPAMIVTSPPNPYLKWEQVQMNNYALDFSLFGKTVLGSLEYYRKRVKDLISRDPLDNTTGFPYMNRNVAGIDGEGIDLMLNVQLIKGSMRWNSGISLSSARDWVTEYKGAMSASSSYVNLAENTVMPVVGRNLVSLYSYPFAGLNPQTGDPLGYSQGEVSDNYAVLMRDSLHNLNYHGSARPLYFGFINNTFQYQNLSLFVNLAFRAGHYFRRNTISYTGVFNSWVTHSDYERRWQHPGDEQITNIPSMVYPTSAARDNFYAGSEVNVERGDVLRLQQVNLTYRFLSPLGKMRYIDVGAHADNLGVIWKATDTERDPDYRFLPPTRRITLNLKVQF